MEFPWSDMPKPLLRALAQGDPRRAVEVGRYLCEKRGIDMNLEYQGTDRVYPVFLTISAVARWMNGRRSLIEISSPSADLLSAWEPRFLGLPLVYDEPWKHGTMFRFSRSGLSGLMYMEPMEGDEPGVSYVLWVQYEDGTWGTVVPKDMSVEALKNSGLDTYTHFTHLLQAKHRLAIAEDGTRVDLGKMRTVGINALAAIHEDPRVVIMGRRKAPRRNRDKAGGIRRVKRLTLSYDGARLVTRRWVILPTPAPTEKIEHKPHASPYLHTVQPHYWRVWVNTPKAGEKVLETREKTRVKGGKSVTYLQYRVKRIRGKEGPYCRGKGTAKPQRTRMVIGPEDLSPLGPS